MNFLPEKKYGVPSHNFVKKNVLCEKGDGTQFNGTFNTHCKIVEEQFCEMYTVAHISKNGLRKHLKFVILKLNINTKDI